MYYNFLTNNQCLFIYLFIFGRFVPKHQRCMRRIICTQPDFVHFIYYWQIRCSNTSVPKHQRCLRRIICTQPIYIRQFCSKTSAVLAMNYMCDMQKWLWIKNTTMRVLFLIGEGENGILDPNVVRNNFSLF